MPPAARICARQPARRHKKNRHCAQRYADMAAVRDRALATAASREARCYELQSTVHELTEQVGRQREALEMGRQLSAEAARAEHAADLAGKEHRASVEALQRECERSLDYAEAARREADAEASRRRALEAAMREQQRRAQRRMVLAREAALTATRVELALVLQQTEDPCHDSQRLRVARADRVR